MENTDGMEEEAGYLLDVMGHREPSLPMEDHERLTGDLLLSMESTAL